MLRRAGVRQDLDACAHENSLAFCVAYRAALEQQRVLLHQAWRWYVLPITVGVLAFHLGQVIGRGGSLHEWLLEPGYPHIVALGGLIISWLNRVAARHIAKERDELDRHLADMETVG